MGWISAIYARHLVHGARSLGVHVPEPPCLKRLGARATLHDRVDALEAFVLFESLLEQTGRRDLGVVAAAAIEDHESPMFHLVSVSRNAGEGLARLVRYAPLLGDAFCYGLVDAGDDEVQLSIQRSALQRPGLDLLMEFELAAFGVGCRLVFHGPDAGWIEGWLRAADAPADALEAITGCRIRAGMPTTLARIPMAALAERSPRPNPGLADFLMRDLDGRLAQLTRPHASVVERVRDHVQRVVATDPSAVSCAAALGMSLRTLTRRLAEAGTSYRTLVDAVRMELALAWLPERELHEIAAALGYSEESAFRRAFRRWTGAAPSVVRRSGLRG